MPRLPPEIIAAIIDSLVPSKDVVAYPASDPVTQCLRACLFVSTQTYFAARRNLYAHCMHIDSTLRLTQVLYALKAQQSRVDEHDQTSTLISDPVVHFIKGLFLAPFPSDTIRDTAIVPQVAELLHLLAPSLQRLVIDMPLRSHYPEDDTELKLRPVLRSAFLSLRNLEDFTSVRDELYLATREWEWNNTEDHVWASWTKLRHLALYNPMIDDSKLLEGLRGLKELRTVIFVRADGIPDGIEGLRPCLPASATAFLVDSEEGQSGSAPSESTEHTNESLAQVLPKVLSSGFGAGVNPIIFCQNWLREMATRGCLWS